MIVVKVIVIPISVFVIVLAAMSIEQGPIAWAALAFGSLVNGVVGTLR